MKKRFLIYILVAFLLIYFAGMLVSQQFEIRERKAEVDALKEEIENVKEEARKLEEEIAHAESRETIEAIAREELGLVYPDERKFVDSNG